MHATVIQTPDGAFTATFSDLGLARLEFPGTQSQVGAHLVSSAPDQPWVELTVRALREALQGRPPKALPPLDLSSGSRFQLQVWQTLASIPTGETRTYTEVSQAVRRPNAARAVGQACGANPIPVLIPCHRVLAAGGKIGGFSGGLDWKRTLLTREQQCPAES